MNSRFILVQTTKAPSDVHIDSSWIAIDPASEALKQLQANEPETWQLLTLACGAGVIYSSDLAEARRCAGDFALSRQGLTADQLNHVDRAAQALIDKYRDTPETFSQDPASPSTALSALSDAPSTSGTDRLDTDRIRDTTDESLVKALLGTCKVALKIIEERNKWKRIFEQMKNQEHSLVFPLRNAPIRPKFSSSPGCSHGPAWSRWGIDWSGAWTLLIVFGLLAFVVVMAYYTGAVRIPASANATGFHIVLPPGHTWSALESSKWNSGRIGAEPYSIVINHLEPQEFEALKEAEMKMAPRGTTISLPVGRAYRTVIPRRGAFDLPTGEVGINYLIDTNVGGWSILTVCLTEVEADALAHTFEVDPAENGSPAVR